jgi:hypothetical protein
MLLLKTNHKPGAAMSTSRRAGNRIYLSSDLSFRSIQTYFCFRSEANLAFRRRRKLPEQPINRHLNLASPLLMIPSAN